MSKPWDSWKMEMDSTGEKAEWDSDRERDRHTEGHESPLKERFLCPEVMFFSLPTLRPHLPADLITANLNTHQ